jgi:nucleoside-diphosphate-sugar epimerase
MKNSMSSPPERVLVTGASGLIGNSALSMLANKGYATIGVSKSKPELINPKTSWISLDLTSAQARNKLDSLSPFDAIVHCAAAIPKSLSNETSQTAGEINSILDQLIIDYCIDHNTRLIYCSSTSVYMPASNEPVDEDHPLDKEFSHYVSEKIASECRIREQVESYVILRICAPYGAKLRARTVLKIFIDAAIAGEVLRYHGSGLREQDFLHVSDIAEGISAAIERKHITSTFNMSGGYPISMRDLASLVTEIAGDPSSKVKCSGEIDAQENYRANFNINRAKNLLGWEPTITLQAGIKEWIDLIRKDFHARIVE